MIISAVQESDSVAGPPKSILFQILFPDGWSQHTGESALCSTAGPCWLMMPQTSAGTGKSQRVFSQCWTRWALVYVGGGAERAESQTPLQRTWAFCKSVLHTRGKIAVVPQHEYFFTALAKFFSVFRCDERSVSQHSASQHHGPALTHWSRNLLSTLGKWL